MQAAAPCGPQLRPGCRLRVPRGAAPPLGPTHAARLAWPARGRGAPAAAAAATATVVDAGVESPRAWAEDSVDEDDGMCVLHERMSSDMSQRFNFARWHQHRSARRYARHVGSLPRSKIARKLAGPLAYVAAVTAAVGAAHAAAAAGALPAGAAAALRAAASMSPFSLTSAALSLLLVFRTNASYARWADARAVWGSVVNRARDLNRQAAAWFPRGAARSAPLAALLRRHTVAFAVALKCHVKDPAKCDAVPLLAGVLTRGEAAALAAAPHRPLAALAVAAAAVAAAEPPPALAAQMDANITALVDAVGACERLLRTPIPLSYTRHTTRVLVLWLSLLPLAMVPAVGAAMAVPVCTFVAFLLLGIEEIGVAIEEPFSLLPLQALCEAIERDSEGLAGAAADGLVAAALAAA